MILKFAYLSVGGLLIAASFLAQQPTDPMLVPEIAALQAAPSLTITFTVAKIPAAPDTWTLSFSKPDRFKIDSPTKVTVSDGKTVYELDKAANTYTQTPATAKTALGDEVAAWAPFFDSKAFDGAKSVKSGAKRTIKGNAVTEIIMSLPGDRTLTLYVDDKLKIARGASLKKGETETFSLAKELTIGAEPLPDADFAFAPPAGAKLQEAPKAENVSYSQVQAIFNRSCVGCHGNSGGLSLESYASLMAGGRRGAEVVPGDPNSSKLVQYITGARSPRMPKGNAPLPDSEIKLISNWIAGGAKEN